MVMWVCPNMILSDSTQSKVITFILVCLSQSGILSYQIVAYSSDSNPDANSLSQVAMMVFVQFIYQLTMLDIMKNRIGYILGKVTVRTEMRVEYIRLKAYLNAVRVSFTRSRNL